MTRTLVARDVAVTRAGHSGGGSLMLGFLDARDTLPAWLDRVVFLDANYNDEHRHFAKLAAWLRGDAARTLVVLAYDDREITLDGKRVMQGPSRPRGGFTDSLDS